ncbi:MAG: serine/threonine protein kinase [Acidobacteriota bacterium]|nr:serine/threonine protein kinase [Acidobacteriota bacterium]
MNISKGTQIGRYEIRSKLGSGGMGEVYLALDTELARTVALKILPAEFTKDHKRLQRFFQEARAASALNHPNILTVHEIGQADSVRSIATEIVDGETLRERLLRSPMTVAEALDVATQTASALAAAHKAGIVHRDIKPENIMIRGDRFVKVLDFGLAKLTERQPMSQVDTSAPTRALVNTEPGVVMGTAYYMSPEQAKGLEVDARTDIWSLGVLLYEMLTGRPPFTGETTADVTAAILKTPHAPLTTYSREVPTKLEEIVEKTLEKDREERYQGVNDLLVDLRRLKKRMEFEAEMERSAAPDSIPPPLSPFSSQRLAWVTGC